MHERANAGTESSIPEPRSPAWHDLQITHAYAETLPAALLAHLPARRVRALEPIVQAHTIDGLVKPA